jgi:RNase H-like domain found in reverse transcriptase/Reverse transcriptase (RNA-dependent DNA polymerase)/Integrase zinc binding domain/Retroviral aspartyl protease/Ty3 transposon capsid-like protein/Integrase core domain/Chromo (CHRromatin Organisation MOdifier) domain
MAAFHAKFEQLKAETQAENERRWAAAEERAKANEQRNSELLVRTILEQLAGARDHLTQQFEERVTQLENAHSRPSDNSPSPELVMTNNRRPHPLGTDADNIRTERTDRYQIPRVECPGFYGDDIVAWIHRCNSYFEMHQVPDHLKTKLATMQFRDKASEWYDGFLIDHDPPDWPTLIRLIKKRFQRQGGKNGMDELKELHQNGSVEEYIEQFERLRSKLLIENRLFTETDFIDVFYSGLKQEIRAFVRAFKPQSLDETFEYALQMESALDTQLKKLKAVNKPSMCVAPVAKPNVTPPVTKSFGNTRNVLVEQRRALGLCFKCGERYYPGHQCKIKVQMLMGQVSKSQEEEGDQVTLEESDQELDNEEAIVSVHLTKPNPHSQCLKFKGKIGNVPVFALIDSGSTHSFIDPSVLRDQQCQIEPTKPLIVMVANGAKMVTDSKCTNLQFSLQGHDFTGNLRLFQIQGYDVILGLDWLSQFATMLVNWNGKWVELAKNGTTTRLQVQEEMAKVQLCHEVQLEKEVKGGSDIMMAQIWLCQETELKPDNTPIELQSLLAEFSCVFDNTFNLPPLRAIDHKIPLLPNTVPVNLRPYRYSYFQKLELEKIVTELLRTSVIRPSTSPFASPALLVKKKDGSWRLCIDYRKLNSVIVKNKYPIPIIDDLLDELHGAQYFSKIDLRSGYHQIRMQAEDEYKTAFRTHEGHYEYQVMSFGLTNAPATFQALMNQVFKPFLRKHVLVFFDDILVYSSTLFLHQQHLRSVLQNLKDNQLFAKRSKCEFGVQTVEYLGHIITPQGVTTDPQKIRVMAEWPIPKTLKELRGFLGLTDYYRKFIKDYGLISKPLTNLLKKNAFHWGDEATTAFQKLKASMCTAPVLALPDFTKPFILETDACDKGIGAVLMQEKKPIAYLSKALEVKSQQLSTYEKEFIALLTAVQKWRHYLQGRSFVIKTDHISLKHLLEQRLNHTLQHKGLCKLLGLDYTIQYKKGEENRAADALSRRVHSTDTGEMHAISEVNPKWLEELKVSYEGDEWAQDVLSADQQSLALPPEITIHCGIIRKGKKIYVGKNEEWRTKVIQALHDSSLGGHSGILGTYQRVRKLFHWPKLKNDVLQHVQRCDTCQLNKGENISSPGLLEPIPIPTGAWEVLTMDFVCGLPRSEGKDVIMVVIDKFIKYCHLIALTHPLSATTVAECFLNTVYKLHGLPSKIITDRDPIFTSHFWKDLMQRIGIKLNYSTSYHPQTDGQSEKLNQCIETYLRCMVSQSPKKWAKWLALAEWWYNTNYHTAIKTTPFEALYGYAPPQLPMGSLPKGSNQTVNELLADRQQIMKRLKEHLTQAQARMKKYADLKRTERSFNVGDWVYLKLQPYRQVTIQGRGKHHKLKPKFYGPFEIVSKFGTVAYELNLPVGSMIHPVFHVSQLKRRIGPASDLRIKLPLVGPEGQIHIEPLAILDRRIIKKNNQVSVEILVQWSSLGSEECTWEDYDQIRRQFPNCSLEDKSGFKGGELSATELCYGLGAVEKFELVKQPAEIRDGPSVAG